MQLSCLHCTSCEVHVYCFIHNTTILRRASAASNYCAITKGEIDPTAMDGKHMHTHTRTHRSLRCCRLDHATFVQVCCISLFYGSDECRFIMSIIRRSGAVLFRVGNWCCNITSSMTYTRNYWTRFGAGQVVKPLFVMSSKVVD